MGSLFTFAIGAVSALILVPVFVNSRYRHRHRHNGPQKGVVVKKTAARKTTAKGGGRNKGK